MDIKKKLLELLDHCCYEKNLTTTIEVANTLVDYLIAHGVTLAKDNNVPSKTNADRIRAMSDEELAVWITSIRLDAINETCKKFDVEIEMPIPTTENTADVCEWLKQPAEGEWL